MQQAEELLRSHDPVGALERFEVALARNAGDLAAISGRVRALWVLRRDEEAQNVLADAFRNHGRGWAALLVAEGTLALGHPDDAGHASIDVGSQGRDDGAALAAFTAAYSIAPDDALVVRGLAMTHRLADRRDEARDLLQMECVTQSPNPGLLVELAWCHYDAGEPQSVLDILDIALHRWPGDLEASLLHTVTLRQLYRSNEARDLLDELCQRGTAPLPVLEVERGQLALHEWRLRTVLQTPCENDESSPSFLEEAERSFRSALDVIPGLPAAVGGLIQWAGYADHLLPEIANCEERSAGVALSRGLVHDHQEHWDKALAAYRRAYLLDPHMTLALALQVQCLLNLERNWEARALAGSVLATSPNYPRVLFYAGTIELNEGRYEAAAAIFEQVGLQIGAGWELAWSLKSLDCVDSAEEVARAALEKYPRHVRLLRLYAECATELGRHSEAADRYGKLREVDGKDSEAHERKKLAKRRTRFHLPRILYPTRQKSQSGTADRAALVAGILPDDTPPRLLSRVQAFVGRQTAVRKWGEGLEDVGMAAGIIGWLPLLCANLLFLRWLSGWQILFLVIADLLSTIVVYKFWLRSRKSTRVMFLSAILGGLALGAVLVLGERGPGDAALILCLTWCFAWTAWCLILAGLLLARTLTKAVLFRLRYRDPVACLVADLVDLIALLSHGPALSESATRRTVLDYLEGIACGQERVLVEPLGRKGRRSTIEEPIDRAFRHHVTGIAAATRDLKRSVLSPDTETWPLLRSQLIAVLGNTVHARWDLLPHRQPDPAIRMLRVRLLSTLRTLLVLVVPPALLIVLQQAKIFPSGLPTALQVAAYLGWPAIVLLLWLDPDLAKKVDLVKSAGNLVQSVSGKPAGRSSENS
ncbi:tetratricopeptide repeat protein [Streptomyces seoulensis]|uniref:tetratricopeptide repeat protein n=1 Tax=Streptomyces seoulensis TaxID=73044 RepID=UPI003C2FB8B5